MSLVVAVVNDKSRKTYAEVNPMYKSYAKENEICYHKVDVEIKTKNDLKEARRKALKMHIAQKKKTKKSGKSEESKEKECCLLLEGVQQEPQEKLKILFEQQTQFKFPNERKKRRENKEVEPDPEIKVDDLITIGWLYNTNQSGYKVTSIDTKTNEIYLTGFDSVSNESNTDTLVLKRSKKGLYWDPSDAENATKYRKHRTITIGSATNFYDALR
jgi:hypothetical protein